MRYIIGQNIRKIREAKDLTQENLAYEIGVSKGTISKIEVGTYNTSMKHFEAIAKALEVDMKEFFKKPQKEYNILEEDSPEKNYEYSATKRDLEKIVEMIQILTENDRDRKVTMDTIISILTIR